MATAAVTKLSANSGLSCLVTNGQLVNVATIAPSPSKDYYQLVVTLNEVILRWWKISLKKQSQKISPGEIKDSYEDFVDNNRTQGEIQRVFGARTLTHVRRLLQGHVDYLPRLPSNVLLKIIEYLPLEDVYRLSQVSKHFYKLCRSNELWKHLYASRCGNMVVSDELQQLAESIGWRSVYFTNKLQLQVQMRRLKAKKETELQQREHMAEELHSEPTLRVEDDADSALTLDELEGAVMGNDQYIIESRWKDSGPSELIGSENRKSPLAPDELQYLLNDQFSKWIYTNDYDDEEAAL